MLELRLLSAQAAGAASRIRSVILGIAEREVDFGRRGFATHAPKVRRHLERAGRAFVAGYNSALSWPDTAALLPRLAEAGEELRGFAHEGAAMALALLDSLTAWRRWRWRSLNEAAPQHTYLLHVGAGWAVARLHLREVPRFLHADPLLWPLVIDGYGFHDGFFKPERTVRRPATPPLPPPLRALYDQGVGRSLWFSCAADPDKIARAVASFAPRRRQDLWSGVGLACAYAGGAGAAAVLALRDRAADLLPHMRQGIIFAAKARLRAGNVTDDTAMACRLVCGMTVEDAVALADETARGLDVERSATPGAYQEWRRRIWDLQR